MTKRKVLPLIPVILESPFAGDVEANLVYAKLCAHDCLLHGEAPFASHLLYTQEGILKDSDPAERDLGIRAGQAWLQWAAYVIVYTDLGISPGMQRGIEAATKLHKTIIFRSLYQPAQSVFPLNPARRRT